MRTTINKYYILACGIICIGYQTINSISLVYNMKIRRAFNVRGALHRDKKTSWVATVLPIAYYRSKNIVIESTATNVQEKRLTIGSLFNLRYRASKALWVEAATGLENERVQSKGTANFKDSRTGCDDIVFSSGYNFFIRESGQIVPYALAGFPTRREVTVLEAQDTLVGTRFFSAGVGMEFSYSFINTIHEHFLALLQLRFLHFFNRELFPILPRDATFQPGNVTDVLVTMQYRKKKNTYEVGYNPTSFSNEAVLLPQKTISGPNFTRQGVYATYNHTFIDVPVIKNPVILGVGFTAGMSKEYNARIISGFMFVSTIF